MNLKAIILTDVIVNFILFFIICVLSFALLFKIKLKLNLATKISFYLNLIALGLRFLFTFWQYKFDDFTSTAGKQIFLFTIDSVVFIFYLNNVSRVIASWMVV